MIPIQSFGKAIQAVENTLQYLKQAGCKGFDCSEQTLRIIEKWGQPNTLPPATLEELRSSMEACRRCSLWRSRSNVVFGQGSPRARLIFVGGCPDPDDDLAGNAFSGAAGQLLTKIIQAIELTREQVFITHVVKCHTPDDRRFHPDGNDPCLVYLKKQIALIKPEFICTLGETASETLLETNAPLSALRGRLHDYHGIKVMPTYAPADLLLHPEKKRDVWEDMKILMKAYAN
jgi:uracil-DNA glycosylase